MKDDSLSKILGVLAVFLAFFAVSGCASSYRQMALKSGEIDTGAYSIALFTVVTRNELKPKHIPVVRTVRLRSDKGSLYRFRIDAPDEALSAYLVSLPLPPGRYTILSFDGESNLSRIRGRFTIPVLKDFEVKKNSIVYLGRINANNRERVKGERRSGPFFPHIHQKESGFAAGAFDVTVLDKYDAEIEVIMERYPSLAGSQIEKAIMDGGSANESLDKRSRPESVDEDGDSPEDY